MALFSFCNIFKLQLCFIFCLFKCTNIKRKLQLITIDYNCFLFVQMHKQQQEPEYFLKHNTIEEKKEEKRTTQ